MMSLSQIGTATNALDLRGHAQLEGVTTDSRETCARKLFVALKGPNFDGHDFLEAAAQADAAAVMVHKPYSGPLPVVRVTNTAEALLDLAKAWRDMYPIPIIAVTGSAGKTTVKEMLASILSLAGPGVVTKGNFNNQIGVPLTLTRLTANDEYAVVEMGMNKPGEISRLSQITSPNVAVITNAGAAHLEGLGSVEEVAKAKAEIFYGLTADGIAVINADDQFADLWRASADSRKQITFGTSAESDVCVRSVEVHDSGQQIKVTIENKELDIALSLSGLHNAVNAGAAIAAAYALGTPFETIVAGLESFKPIAGRSNTIEMNGITLIDDAYNANPLSMTAAVDMLVAQDGKRRVLVLGDMAELGEGALEAHAALGRYIANQSISMVYATGELMQALVSELGPTPTPTPTSSTPTSSTPTTASHFDNKRDMLECLGRDLKQGDVVLIKGSRVAGMDEIVNGLMAEYSNKMLKEH